MLVAQGRLEEAKGRPTKDMQMTRQYYWALRLLAGMMLALLLAGCDDPQTRDIITRRQDNLAWTLQQFQEIEASSPASMAWALSQMREQYERDVDNTANNPARVNELIKRDFDRWDERQPAYKEWFKQQLQGNPDNIRRTAPKMVW